MLDQGVEVVSTILVSSGILLMVLVLWVRSRINKEPSEERGYKELNSGYFKITASGKNEEVAPKEKKAEEPKMVVIQRELGDLDTINDGLDSLFTGLRSSSSISNDLQTMHGLSSENKKSVGNPNNPFFDDVLENLVEQEGFQSLKDLQDSLDNTL